MGLQEKKDERGVVVRNKARLVTQGHKQEERIDYVEVFALVARIEAIGIFFAIASYMGFIVYQMNVKSGFLYGKIDEEVYVSQPLGFIDPKFPNKVYKVVKALYGLHQALSAWYATLSTFLVQSRYRRGLIDKTLFIKKDKKDIMLKEDGIFISQDKYVAEILKKFDFLSVKTVSTPIETKKPLVKDKEASDVDVHLYRSMIGSLMYLTASRPDIVRLISWQCKKQTDIATLTTEAEYIAAASCCGQVLWIQNQILDYGFNFMNTKIYIDNESIICSFKCWLITTPQMVINSPCLTEKKELAIPRKTATCKELLNPLMAGSLPKTTLPTKLLKVNAVRLKLTTDRVYAAEAILDNATVKTVNDEVWIQALVDGKRVNIKESSIRRTPRLDNAEGTSCLTNIEIFEGLVKIGAKTTSWNEFSNTMASAIICLATHLKFNFSRREAKVHGEVERIFWHCSGGQQVYGSSCGEGVSFG
nr:hypothetical protein [Tanacetum cinerariifolium]